MKAKIHPKYYNDLKITCSCGNVIIAGSTKENVHTEICSACHPFYTGQQKLIDTAGRVDKFLARVKKAQALKEKEVKKVDTELDEIFEEPKEKLKEAILAEQPKLLEEEIVEETVSAPEVIETAAAKKEKKAPAKKTASAETAAVKKTPAKKTAAKKK
jgi:large subunit ribosomal protein L31